MQASLDFGGGDQVQPFDDDLPGAVEAVIVRLCALLLKHPVCCAYSSGKDSTGLLALLLLARLRLKQQGLVPVAPIYVMHGNTEVESPAVASLAAASLMSLEAWCKSEGIDLRVEISTPALSATFAVKVLSGGALPVWTTTRHRRCSVDWKIAPARVSARRIAGELKTAADACGRAVLPLVTLLGTRHEESDVRARNMARRGDNADEIREFDGRLLLAPIADWTEEMVWEFIALLGLKAGIYPVWQADFSALVLLYRDALGGECPIVAGAGALGRAGCGARTGCHSCTAVAEDKSLSAMAQDERHAYLRPLVEIRNVLHAVQTDYTRRSWLTRQLAEFGGVMHVKIQPDHFHSGFLLDLVGAYLLADHDERVRAERFDRAVRQGKLPDDAYMTKTLLAGETPLQDYVDKMRRPQFQTFDDRKLVALDFYSAVLGKYRRPFTILETAHRIEHEGFRPTLPSIEAKAHERAPEARWLPLPMAGPIYPGFAEPLVLALAGEACFSQDEIHGDGLGSYVTRGGDTFDVDAEAAFMVVDMDYPDRLRDYHRNDTLTALGTIHSYLSLGVVALSAQGRTRLNAIVKTRQHLESMGLYDLDTQELLARSIRTPGAPRTWSQEEMLL